MRKLPKTLLKYCQPIDAKDEFISCLIWIHFKHSVTGQGRKRRSEEDRQQLTKLVLGDIFCVPENQWHRFTKPSRYDPDCPRRAAKRINKWIQEELGKNRNPGRKGKPKPPKQKFEKVLIRRNSRTLTGDAPLSQIILIPAKTKGR